jgi:hypothetical protein
MYLFYYFKCLVLAYFSTLMLIVGSYHCEVVSLF